jgi:hypothetical protein
MWVGQAEGAWKSEGECHEEKKERTRVPSGWTIFSRFHVLRALVRPLPSLPQKGIQKTEKKSAPPLFFLKKAALEGNSPCARGGPRAHPPLFQKEKRREKKRKGGGVHFSFLFSLVPLTHIHMHIPHAHERKERKGGGGGTRYEFR